MKTTDRRQFLRLMGMGAMATTLNSNISKALAIPANHRTGTIKDVEHVVVLMQENRPFDHHFGTLRGVRGFADPRAVNIHLPLQHGGSALASVFLQPAGAALTAAGYAVPADHGNLGGPTDGAFVIPPFRVKPESINPAVKGLGSAYLPGTGHNWAGGQASWNHGQYDAWAPVRGPMAMSYMTRDDLPFHFALADAFTVGDAYFCSVMGPTNPNRCYLWTGCIGNVSYLGAAGTDGHGAGPVTYNGWSVNNQPLAWETFPETLTSSGISWKIYQDLAGATFEPDFGDGTGNAFAGNFTDNSVLYFKQYREAAPGTPLFDNGCTGTHLVGIQPPDGAPASAWEAWADHLFDDFRKDVESGTLPQVSWLCAPAGYTEHSDWPMNYGAWYIAKVFDILVSNPQVFSKTVFIVNYDEADGSFDHVVPPTAPMSPEFGASTVSIDNEIVTGGQANDPTGPVGLGTRVPLIAISPWSKGGYVNSQVFDHTSIIRFIEERFGVHERNISPWRRAVCGDLTSLFDFTKPKDKSVKLPSTKSFLPSPVELAGGNVDTFVPTPDDVIFGIPAQEKGIRPARALPYELNVHADVDAKAGTIHLTFENTGKATAVFQVRSANPADAVRGYTVEPGTKLTGTWSAAPKYDLSVFGPNGFARYFAGSSAGALLNLHSSYESDDEGELGLRIANIAAHPLTIKVTDAYTGHLQRVARLEPQGSLHDKNSLDAFHGWYDLVVTVSEDADFKYRLAGHIETGRDSFSDPAMGGLVKLKA
jgi:phospholipase C